MINGFKVGNIYECDGDKIFRYKILKEEEDGWMIQAIHKYSGICGIIISHKKYIHNSLEWHLFENNYKPKQPEEWL
jgi:hypothetical protein